MRMFWNKQTRVWMVICVLMLLTGAVILWICDARSYFAARSSAKDAYVNSRDGDPESYEFVASGVEYGMTSHEVQKLMGTADRKLCQMPQSSPPWNGLVDLYVFNYKASWRSFCRSQSKIFYEEWFWVYYNQEGQAVKLQRDMVKGSGSNVVVDLESKVLEVKK